MNLRHAAALGLVGWYLFDAPSTFRYWDGAVRNTSAPLMDWEVEGHYDSLAACREEAITHFSPPMTANKGHLYVLKKKYLYDYGVQLGYVRVSDAASYDISLVSNPVAQLEKDP
jgi:hypothetical protein